MKAEIVEQKADVANNAIASKIADQAHKHQANNLEEALHTIVVGNSRTQYREDDAIFELKGELPEKEFGQNKFCNCCNTVITQKTKKANW